MWSHPFSQAFVNYLYDKESNLDFEEKYTKITIGEKCDWYECGGKLVLPTKSPFFHSIALSGHLNWCVSKKELESCHLITIIEYSDMNYWKLVLFKVGQLFIKKMVQN